MSEITTLSHQVNRLEKRLFEIICLLMFLVMMHGLIQGVLVFNRLSFLSYIEAFVAAIGLSFFYLSKYREWFEKLRFPLIVIVNSFLVFFWYHLSGYLGPTAVGGIAVVIISIIIVPGRWRTQFMIFGYALIVFLVISQLRTNWVQTAPEGYPTMPYDYLVMALAVFLVINYLKNEFDKERRTVLQQNVELGFLNKELEKTLNEKEQVIERLKNTSEQLIESAKLASIGKLTAGLAHELNNPLNYIGGIVTPAKRDLDEIKTFISPKNIDESKEVFEDLDRLLDGVESGTRKASGIIHQLIKLSPEENREVFAPINLENAIKSILFVFERSYPSIDFGYKIDPALTINGNHFEFNQALNNIIQNSVQAIPDPEKGRVKISGYQKERSVVIVITDNGTGIEPEHLKKVFDPFFTTKNPGEGTGLGLTLAYSILKKHSGEIKVESVTGIGSKVTVFLPGH